MLITLYRIIKKYTLNDSPKNALKKILRIKMLLNPHTYNILFKEKSFLKRQFSLKVLNFKKLDKF